MSCKLIGICPSSSGWCKRRGAAPSAECVDFVISAYAYEHQARVMAERGQEGGNPLERHPEEQEV